MDFHLAHVNEWTQQSFMGAIVHVTLDADLPGAIKFEVDLGSLPEPNYTDGNEVIVRFTIPDFTNNGTFWTDSNGLEMQKRVLNYRKSFKLEDYYFEHNTTTNYYPITSAISMKDVNTGYVFTVMNDRSQGGSSLHKNSIELMQNRLLVANDGLGQDDRLVEHDEFGNRIRTFATYTVQLHQPQKQEPLQRKV